MTDIKPPMTPGERWLFVSDVDDTLLGNDAALMTLNRALSRSTNPIVVAYNSSRPCESLRRSIEENVALTVPNYLIGALGTEIQIGRTGRLLADYSQYIGRRWDRDQVHALAVELGFSPHAPEFQTPLKASFDVPGQWAASEMARRLKGEALEAKVIFSGGKNLDLIPLRAGKGNAIRFLSEKLVIDPSCVVAAGDSGNDLEMFVAPRKGIIVGNADEELKRLQDDHIYHASAAHAAGVLEGLRYWGVLA